MPRAFTCRSPWTLRPVLGRLALLTTEKGVYLPLTPSSVRTAPPPRSSPFARSPNDGSLVWEQRNYVNECIPSHMHPETGQGEQACLCLVEAGNKCTVALKLSPFISLRLPLSSSISFSLVSSLSDPLMKALPCKCMWPVCGFESNIKTAWRNLTRSNNFFNDPFACFGTHIWRPISQNDLISICK